MSDIHLEFPKNKTYINDNPLLPKKKTIVITHHVPTSINYPEIYKESKLIEGFTVA